MDEKIQLSLNECVAKDRAFQRFYRGNTYEYFKIFTKKLNDYTSLLSETEPLYFIKDPWDNYSYIMLSECMFNKTFVKLYNDKDKTDEFFDDVKVALPEDNSQIVIEEDKKESNDHSFIEANKYR